MEGERDRDSETVGEAERRERRKSKRSGMMGWSFLIHLKADMACTWCGR